MAARHRKPPRAMDRPTSRATKVRILRGSTETGGDDAAAEIVAHVESTRNRSSNSSKPLYRAAIRRVGSTHPAMAASYDDPRTATSPNPAMPGSHRPWSDSSGFEKAI